MGASCCGLRRPGNSGHAGQAGAGGPGLCFPGSLSLGVPRRRGLAPPSPPPPPPRPPPLSPNPNPGCHTFLQLLLASLSEDSSPQVTRETRRHSNRNRLVPPAPRRGGRQHSPGCQESQARPRVDPCPASPSLCPLLLHSRHLCPLPPWETRGATRAFEVLSRSYNSPRGPAAVWGPGPTPEWPAPRGR